MTALTTIFVHVVSNPFDESAQNDIALMEVIVGFFGRLEYVTSGEAAFTKTTEFVRRARSVTDRRVNAARAASNSETLEVQANPRGYLGLSLEDRMDTETRPLELNISDIQDGESNNFHLISSQLLSAESHIAFPGLQRESVTNSEAKSTDTTHRLGIANDDISAQALYNDMIGLLASPSGGNSTGSWFGG